MRQPGEITQVRDGMIQVTFCRPDACAKCNVCEGGKREHSIWVRGAGRVGDIAVVEMPNGMVFRASLLAYGIPLAGLIAGLMLGLLVSGWNETVGAIGAAFGLALGFLILRITERNRTGRDEWTPKVVDILEREDGEKPDRSEE